MKIGGTLGIKTSTFISTLVVLMLLSQPGWAGVYSCWGGCLNQCVLLGDKKPEEKVPCYWNCLAKCFPQPGRPPISSTKIALDSTGTTASSASELPGSSNSSGPHVVGHKTMFGRFGLSRKYYCIIGCSFQNCMMPTRDKTDLKTCLVRCTHKCKH